MKNEKWDDVHGNTTPDDRMVAFLESPTDSYAILQLREDVDDNIPLMFANYSYLQKKEMEPEIDRYEVVYHGSISMSEDVNLLFLLPRKKSTTSFCLVAIPMKPEKS